MQLIQDVSQHCTHWVAQERPISVKDDFKQIFYESSSANNERKKNQITANRDIENSKYTKTLFKKFIRIQSVNNNQRNNWFKKKLLWSELTLGKMRLYTLKNGPKLETKGVTRVNLIFITSKSC